MNVPVIPVPPLTIEIWERCWRLGDLDNASIASLSLTCRLFRWLVRPLQFRKLTISARTPPQVFLNQTNWNEWAFPLISRMGFYLRTAFGRDALLVREVTLRGLERNTPRNKAAMIIYIDFLRQFFSFLPNLKYVNTLVVSNVEIHPRGLQALSGLPLLRTLSLEKCVVTSNVNLRLPLKELTITDTYVLNKINTHRRLISTSGIFIFNPNVIVRLNLQTVFDSSNVVLTLTNVKLPMLNHLGIWVNSQYWNHFIQLLLHCPQLGSLHLHRLSSLEWDTRLVLPQQAIPLLTKFAGPYRTAHIFVPDRPVVDVDLSQSLALWDPSDLEKTVHCLRRSTKDITTLRLPPVGCRMDVFKLLREGFQNLQSLAISIEDVKFGEYSNTTRDPGGNTQIEVKCMQENFVERSFGSFEDILFHMDRGRARLPSSLDYLDISRSRSGELVETVAFCRERWGEKDSWRRRVVSV